MRRWRRVACSAASIAVVGAFVTVPSPVHASTTYTIGVDAPSPAGHDWLFTDFFPDSGTVVAPGDIVDFAWNQGSPDGFHTATVLKDGETLGAELALIGPPAVPDGDDVPPTGLEFNPQIGAPQLPAAGCGQSPSTPCVDDGTNDVSSGAVPTASGAHFFVQLNEPAGTTITFMCRVHPGMQGTLTVGGSTPSTPNQVASAAASQYQARTTAAFGAEAAANTEAISKNVDGTHTITMTAGTAVPGVEIVEMLPRNVRIAAGDTVRWNTSTINDVHTVTFPEGAGSAAVDPIPISCESGSTDTPPTGPPPAFGCGSPAQVETGFVPQPQGATVISTPTTVGSSGILASSATPFPQSYQFSFPSAGVFHYQCRIHDHMTGTIDVTNAASYLMAGSDGGVFPFGHAAQGLGSLGGTRLNKPVVGIASTGDGAGYWMVASDGGIFPFGDAGGFGSTGAIRLNQPVVGMAPTPDGGGYWLVAADGGIFPFGDAGGYGSTGGIRLNKPIVGMAATPSGLGYWLVASDGGVFPFGDAVGFGSTGAIRLNKPMVGMAATPTGHGYWLVASDGGIFPFGDAAGMGSTGNIVLNKPINTMVATVHGDGYWLIASDGGVFPFGMAQQGLGSLGAVRLNKPIVSATGA